MQMEIFHQQLYITCVYLSIFTLFESTRNHMENSQQNPTGSIEWSSKMLFKQNIFSSFDDSEQNIRALPPTSSLVYLHLF